MNLFFRPDGWLLQSLRRQLQCRSYGGSGGGGGLSSSTVRTGNHCFSNIFAEIFLLKILKYFCSDFKHAYVQCWSVSRSFSKMILFPENSLVPSLNIFNSIHKVEHTEHSAMKIHYYHHIIQLMLELSSSNSFSSSTILL